MYLISLFLPLCSFLLIGFFGRFFGSKGSALISIFSNFIAFLASLFIFFEVLISNSTCFIFLWDWLNLSFFKVSITILFDPLTAIMFILVTFISLMVNIYSYEYMYTDPHLPRFFAYLSLFTFFMLSLVSASNFLQLFFGWEGVGLTSYLLINFWFTRILANKAALKAMLMNRIGDISLLFAMGIIVSYFSSLDFYVIFPLIPFFNDVYLNFFGYNLHLLSTISFFLLLAAVGKSAQFGLHTWLPDAMEGPTPVSALIHAATMVTAGVFLIIRTSFFFEYSPLVLNLTAFIGVFTAFFASTVGIFQNDLKKIIAYSTCSQLGYMFLACGCSNYLGGMFHLLGHGFFKALLFLSAGSIIHAMSGEQDIRKMGGLVNILPFSYICVLIGSLALCGFPFLTGFYSKDFIIELSNSIILVKADFFYYVSILAAFFTSFYSARLICLVFFTKTNFYRSSSLNIHEPSIFMYFPLFFLAFLSLFIGFFFSDFHRLSELFSQNSILILPENFYINFFEYNLNPIKRNLTLFVTILGGSFGFISNFNDNIVFKTAQIKIKFYYLRLFYFFFAKAWYIDSFYNYFITNFFIRTAYTTFTKVIDKISIELLKPYLFFNTIYSFSKNIKYILESGFIYRYVFLFFLFFSLLICIILIIDFLTLTFTSIILLFFFCIFYLVN